MQDIIRRQPKKRSPRLSAPPPPRRKKRRRSPLFGYLLFFVTCFAISFLAILSYVGSLSDVVNYLIAPVRTPSPTPQVVEDGFEHTADKAVQALVRDDPSAFLAVYDSTSPVDGVIENLLPFFEDYQDATGSSKIVHGHDAAGRQAEEFYRTMVSKKDGLIRSYAVLVVRLDDGRYVVSGIYPDAVFPDSSPSASPDSQVSFPTPTTLPQ